MENLRIMIGLALAFLIVVAIVGYFIHRGAGSRSRTDLGSGKKNEHKQ